MFKKIIFSFSVLIFLSSSAFAARTDCVSQMALADTSGNPITAAVDYELHFYPTITGGAELTTAATGTATPSNGTLSIPFDCDAVTSNAAVFMEYVIDGETLTPRVEMVSSPFAAVAFTALNVPSGAISNDSITTNLIVDGTITSSDIALDAIGAAQIATDAVTLETQTTGNYVASITAGTGISTTGASSGEGIAHTISIDQTFSPTWTGTHRFNGNVGIGKAPTVALDVSGNVATSGTLNVGGLITASGAIQYTVQAFSIADNGGPGASVGTTGNITSSYLEGTCLDPIACDVTLSESGILQGQIVTIINMSAASTLNFSDVAGVQDVSTVGMLSATPHSVITFIYIGDQWIEVSRSTNN
ncbi:MAG: hypothetical protein IPJ69_06045 [Deltaproteobacteria bacterium]|nr:MAG: hypothetical protein IPJ69_06045 [Deltaproteobacteria bacterium]